MRSRSSGVVIVANTGILTPSTTTVASGFALMFVNHAGSWSCPPKEAATRYPPASCRYMRGCVRRLPLRRPTVLSSRIG